MNKDREKDDATGFVLDLDLDLTDPSDGDLFPELFVAIDGQEEIGNESGQELDGEAIPASGDEVIDSAAPMTPTPILPCGW
jgi:hypothetical protein